jgi:hypothetical protein
MSTKRPGWQSKGPTRYRVISLVDGDVWDCETSKQVALLMWGRDVKDYAYFKDRRRFETTQSDLGAFQKALEDFRPAKETV